MKIGATEIPRGNFCIFADILRKNNRDDGRTMQKIFNELEDSLFEMEGKLLVNLDECMSKARIVYEQFSYAALRKIKGNRIFRKGDKKGNKKGRDVLAEHLADFSSEQNGSPNDFEKFYEKHILADRSAPWDNPNLQKARTVLEKIESTSWYDPNLEEKATGSKKEISETDIEKRKLLDLIRNLYTYTNHSHHADGFVYSFDDGSNFVESFYYFLASFCELNFPAECRGETFEYAPGRLPIGEYVCIPEKQCQELGMSSEKKRKCYTRSENGRLRYYLGVEIKDKSYSVREVNVFKDLWDSEKNIEDPEGIIRPQEKVRLTNDRSMLFLECPNKPEDLSKQLLDAMSLDNKKKIYREAEKAVKFLHEAQPPYYHRGICPDAFTLFKRGGAYQLRLSNLGTVKPVKSSSHNTVRKIVERNKEDEFKRQFMSNELLNIDLIKEAALPQVYRRADEFALGKLGVYIFTGTTDEKELEKVEGIEEEKERILEHLRAGSAEQ